MGSYGTIRDHTGLYGTIRDHNGPYGTIRDHRPYWTIQDHSYRAYGFIQDHPYMGLHGTIWDRKHSQMALNYQFFQEKCSRRAHNFYFHYYHRMCQYGQVEKWTMSVLAEKCPYWHILK